MSKSRKINTTSASSRRKRRWLNVGPGIVIALAISALIGSQWIKTEIAARQQKNTPPVIERQVVTSSYEERLGPTPEVDFIITRAEKLQITNTQLAQLKVLRTEWKKFYTPRIIAANQAAEKTNKYLTGAKDRQRTPVAQIQDAAAPIITLSREISSARRSYWDRALNVLDQKQREVVGKERENDWTTKKAKMTTTKK